jgi:hypothetical protein
VASPIASVSGAACELPKIAALKLWRKCRSNEPSQWLAIADILVIASSTVRCRPDGDRAGLGTAGFEIKFPENWNDKFLFWGSPRLGKALHKPAAMIVV